MLPPDPKKEERDRAPNPPSPTPSPMRLSDDPIVVLTTVFAAVLPASFSPTFAPILPNIAHTTKSPYQSFSVGRDNVEKHHSYEGYHSEDEKRGVC